MTFWIRATTLVGSLLLGACSVKSLPQGTPPPAYEQRTFEPWPPNAPDGGADAEPSLPAAAPNLPPIPVETDAGIPAAAASPDASDSGAR